MRLLSIAFLALLATTANAESAFRVGLGAGQVNLQNDEIDLDSKTTGWEAFVGWEANRQFAIEAGYLDGGTVEGIDVSSFHGSAVGSLWATDSFGVFGRVGLLRWKADAGYDSISGSDPYFGAGVAGLIEGALLRLEYRVAKLDKVDIDFSMIAGSIVWRF